MAEIENVWATVANLCLDKSKKMLLNEETPTAATVEVIEKLVNIAVAIDILNVNWAAIPPSKTIRWVE